MSAWLKPSPLSNQPQTLTLGDTLCTLRRARRDDLTQVARIEQEAYAFPWTLGNFQDALVAQYDFWVLEQSEDLAAHAVVMWIPDEAHLLNITVRPGLQGQGWGRLLMRWLMQDVKARGARSLMLEVRPSNVKALALYDSLGFAQIGLRKGYYPSWNNSREDAFVLSHPFHV